MVRLTRAEQQVRTHEHLLRAGHRVFLRRGFLGASVEEIAAEAGYTRGAVYKHFGGKEGLWLAIVEADAGTHLQGLRSALEQATCRDDVIAILSGVTDEEAAKWTSVAAEVLAATAQQPEIAAQVAALQQRHDDQVVALLAEHLRRLGLEPTMPLPQLVVLLGALGIGLALRRVVVKGADAHAVLVQVLEKMLPTP
ncbi:TetR/AcrR family transcriptional regulator [Lentzea sp. BCCO 10_0798]|uniref:TetR/AcrR family transcriptional regulator n=1 Tax=Lentzea kristufekii TaxID=3095430 RepID=A0ABU4U0L5_9PSEU|nr:TetR/AcrR family transcriptional regulator [Lentzea sp. BCCO 10_0798]MDX8054108.1 TetR/AcrR family transcriptional regulator [Lentzea sp. BCCO 10_0798]